MLVLSVQVLLKLLHVLLHQTNADISFALAVTVPIQHQLLHFLQLEPTHQFFEFFQLLLNLELSTFLQLPFSFSQQHLHKMIVLLQAAVFASKKLIYLQQMFYVNFLLYARFLLFLNYPT